MSGRRFLGFGLACTTLLAVYACGDDGVVTPPDDTLDATKSDAGATDGKASAIDRFVPSEPLPPSTLALGDGFGCIVAADHTVYCWGRNDFGQLGSDPAKTPSCGAYPCTPTPTKVDGLENVVAITAGKDFACALDDAKHGWCWGNNSKEQIAGRGVASRFTPKIVTDGTAQIVASGQHACILDTQGFLHCWGDNDCDLFDAGDAGSVGIVELVTPPMKQISIGPDAICTVGAEAGEVFCWGADHKGSLGHPVADNAPTCAGGLPNDKSPKRWVADTAGHTLSGMQEVHVGHGIACAKKIDGTTLCVGDNSHGGLGQGVPDGNTHFVPLEVPAVRSIALDVAGETACVVAGLKLLCWGAAAYGQMDTSGPADDCGGTPCRPLGYVLPNQTPIRSFAMSEGGIGTIKEDVSVWLWGKNDSGQAGVASSDAANTTCSGSKCIAGPRQMTNLPALQ